MPKDKEKRFVVVYNGGVGRKAISERTAVKIAKEYISAGKCKKADIYELVRKVK